MPVSPRVPEPLRSAATEMERIIQFFKKDLPFRAPEMYDELYGTLQIELFEQMLNIQSYWDAKAAEIAKWIAYDIIGNEMHGVEPFPEWIRPYVARAMVSDSRIGYPSETEALDELRNWKWE